MYLFNYQNRLNSTQTGCVQTKLQLQLSFNGGKTSICDAFEISLNIKVPSRNVIKTVVRVISHREDNWYMIRAYTKCSRRGKGGFKERGS